MRMPFCATAYHTHVYAVINEFFSFFLYEHINLSEGQNDIKPTSFRFQFPLNCFLLMPRYFQASTLCLSHSKYIKKMFEKCFTKALIATY